MNAPHEPGHPAQDLSRALLLGFSAVIIGALCLLQYNVLYTEGEVMQGMFSALLILLAAGTGLIACRARRAAAWFVMVFGGALLLWQANQSRRWTVLQEEVFAIVHFAEDTKGRTGQYPADLDGYAFRNPRLKAHIHGFEPEPPGGFRLHYFLNHSGTGYWYSSRTGFGYYPD